MSLRLACTATWFALMAGLTADAASPATHPVPAAASAALARFHQAQQGIDSLKLTVLETRVLPLLAKPEVLRGSLIVDRGQLRLDYREPEPRSYVLKDGKLTGWIPSQKRVEQADVSRRLSRLKKLFALGQPVEELAKDFEIAVAAGNELAGTDEILLIPRSKRVARRVREVRLWLDREIGLPKRIEYTTGDGNRISYDLSGVQINPAVAAATFELSYPADAKVVRGLESLGLGGSVVSDDEL